jgi:hypothetical protein
MRINYSDQLKSKYWLSLRELILERDNYKCQECNCESNKLNVHHKVYIENRMAWDYSHLLLITLCPDCHKKVHARMTAIQERIGFMTKDQLYFAVDIINMLQLATPEQGLKTLEYLTNELKNTIHE